MKAMVLLSNGKDRRVYKLYVRCSACLPSYIGPGNMPVDEVIPMYYPEQAKDAGWVKSDGYWVCPDCAAAEITAGFE